MDYSGIRATVEVDYSFCPDIRLASLPLFLVLVETVPFCQQFHHEEADRMLLQVVSYSYFRTNCITTGRII